MTLRILGASHANALRFGYELNHADHPSNLEIRCLGALGNFFEPFHTFENNQIRFTNETLRDGFKMGFGVDKISASDGCWGVVAGFTSVRIWAAWFWADGYYVSGANNGANHHLSSTFIRHLNRRLNGPWMALIKDMRRMGLRVILISAPPPMLIHPSFDVHITHEVVAQVHPIIENHWAEFCEDNSVEAVRVPARMRDENGFLSSEYSVDNGEKDHTHGNLAYGEQMLKELFKIL